jgi:hypothetical protein
MNARSRTESAAQVAQGPIVERARTMAEERCAVNDYFLIGRPLAPTDFVSPKHLHRYLAEMTWRYNRRGNGEGSRFNALIEGAGGRLKYKALIA